MSKPQQLCRWPGSKRRLMAEILPHFPEQINCYFEPFLGAGSVLLTLIDLGRLNSDSDVRVGEQGPLRDVWSFLMHGGTEEVVEHYDNFVVECGQEGSNDWAKDELHNDDSSIRAAAFLYLQETSFNGLWRVNRKGEHNVPRDRSRRPKPADVMMDHLDGIVGQLRRVKSLEFWNETGIDQPLDVVYLDPPYFDKFSAYSPEGFSFRDQQDWAAIARDCFEAGALVIASNSDTPEIRNLYDGFKIHELSRDNRISAKASTRTTKQSELLMIADGRSK